MNDQFFPSRLPVCFAQDSFDTFNITDWDFSFGDEGRILFTTDADFVFQFIFHAIDVSGAWVEVECRYDPLGRSKDEVLPTYVYIDQNTIKYLQECIDENFPD